MKITTVTLLIGCMLVALPAGLALGHDTGGEVKSLEAQVKMLSSKIDQLTEDKAELQEQVDAHDEDTAELRDQVAALQATVAELTAQLADRDAAPAEAAPEEDAGPVYHYLGREITTHDMDALWLQYGHQFMVRDDELVSAGAAIAFRDARAEHANLRDGSKWIEYTVQYEGGTIRLEIPEHVTVVRLVDGGAVCSAMSAPDDGGPRTVFLQGQHKVGDVFQPLMTSEASRP